MIDYHSTLTPKMAKSKHQARAPLKAAAGVFTETPAIGTRRNGMPDPALVLVLYAAAVFLVTYLSDPNRPGAIWKNGWYDIWSDQIAYFDMLNGISQGNLGHFTYPSLYPIFGWCFRIFGPDPFLIVDLVLFSLFVFFSLRVFESFLKPRVSLIAGFILVHAAVPYFEIPWTSTVSAAALAAIVYLLLCRPSGWKTGIAIGLCLGAMFGARIGDVAIGGLAAGGQLWTAPSDRRSALRQFLLSMAAFAAFAGALLIFNYGMSGSALGRYLSEVRDTGFNPLAAPWKLYGYLIDPFTYAGETSPLSKPFFAVLPLILLSPPGLVLLWRKHRRTASVLLLCVAGWLLIYLGSVALTGLTLKYGSMHYVKMLFPILIGSSMFLVTALVDREISWRPICIYAAVVFVCALAPHTIAKPRRVNASNIKVSASQRSSEAWKAIDADESTGWDSGVPQRPGMAFDIDLGKVQFVYRITLDAKPGPGSSPRDASVWRSGDGVHWLRVMAVNQSQLPILNDYRFDPVRTRYLRLRLEHGGADTWSIHELAVYAP